MKRPLLCSVLWLSAVTAIQPLAPAHGQTFTPIRVNAGGSAYTDGAGNAWSADTGYDSGSTATTGNAIAGTSDDALFQSVRYTASSSFAYSFTVPNGGYHVKLLLAEMWTFSVGGRRFSVELEGNVALPDVDIYAEAGANTALIKTAPVAVTDGQINIRFVKGVNNPFVAAIEITEVGAPFPPTSLEAYPFSASQINLSWGARLALSVTRSNDVKERAARTSRPSRLLLAPVIKIAV